MSTDEDTLILSALRDKFDAMENENRMLREAFDLAVGRDEQTLVYLLAEAKKEIERLRAECHTLNEQVLHWKRIASQSLDMI